MQPDNRKRIWFWSLFFSAVVAVYIFGIYPQRRILAQGRRTADLIEQRISADARFIAIRVHRVTNGAVIVRGEARSDSDIDALKRLIDDTKPPQKPIFSVHVTSTPQ